MGGKNVSECLPMVHPLVFGASRSYSKVETDGYFVTVLF